MLFVPAGAHGNCQHSNVLQVYNLVIDILRSVGGITLYQCSPLLLNEAQSMLQMLGVHLELILLLPVLIANVNIFLPVQRGEKNKYMLLHIQLVYTPLLYISQNRQRLLVFHTQIHHAQGLVSHQRGNYALLRTDILPV